MKRGIGALGRKIARYTGIAFAALLGIMVVKTLLVKSKQPPAGNPELTPAEKAIDANAAAAHLSAAVRVKSVSVDADAMPEIDALRDLLAKTYPKVHAALTRETIGHGFLFTWKGKNAAADPVLLLAHLDVVPVDDGSLGAWTHPPFDGVIDGQTIWGRGTLDDKTGVIGILEAAEALLGEGWTPDRTIMFGFGSDEEILGTRGAAAIADALAARGVHAKYLLDEGGAVTRGIVPNVKAPVAVIGLAEKGFLTVDLSVSGLGGHSSTPPKDTAISILATAVKRLVDHPLPARIDGPMTTFFEWTAPEMSFGPRLALSNMWLTKPIVIRGLLASPTAGASIRTTTAPTLFHAGNADNVLPATATATMNFRLVPGDTTDAVLAHVKTTIDDSRIVITPREGTRKEASAVSPAEVPEFTALAQTVREVFPDAVVAPNISIGATDARRYAKVTPNAYRFLPIELEGADLKRMHGTNERITIEALGKAIRFYRRLMRTTATN